MDRIRQFLSAFTPRRRVAYIVGILFLALGITMNTKTGMGVSPVIAVAYNIAVILGIPFGTMTFFYYAFLILVQFLILGRAFDHIQWLQLAASFLTSAFISLFDYIVPSAGSVVMRFVLLGLAVLMLGIGIILTVGARFVPNPADGTASAISQKSGLSLGLSKNLLDLVSIAIALALGFLFEHRILGIGVGTVVTMLLTGRVVALLQKPIERLARLAEFEEGAL